MTATRIRSLFLSHGAPTLAVSQHPAARFLAELGRTLARPTAVVVVSAHWQTDRPTVRTAASLVEWHDFGGFPPALYRLRYRPPGSPALAEHVAALLERSGTPVARETSERIDHGVWVPLGLMYPQADLPVVQLSLTRADAQAHERLGRALRPLADENVLVIGSGSLVHNLGRLVPDESAPPEPWAVEFADWMCDAMAPGREQDRLAWTTHAPHAASAHPSHEHLLPLFVARGAAGSLAPIYTGYSYGNLAMHALAG